MEKPLVPELVLLLSSQESYWLQEGSHSLSYLQGGITIGPREDWSNFPLSALAAGLP